MADLDALLAPLTGDLPAGPDLDDDDRRVQLRLAFETSASGNPEAGNHVDWRGILGAIEEQGAVTRDIWLPVYMARAGAKSGDLDVVEQAFLYLAGLCENFWDSMHPSLEDLELQGRLTPCQSLTSIGGFLRPLREVILIEHQRFGRFSGADIERIAADGDSDPSYGAFRAALDEVTPEALAVRVRQLAAIRESIERVDRLLAEKGDGVSGVDFAPIYATLDSLRKAAGGFAGLEVEAASDGETGADAARDDAASPPAGNGVLPARLESRADVMRALDAAIDYYRRREPASPVPVALKRAKAWVDMDFLSIIEDIVPDSLVDARRVLTSQRDESG
jgi:type VI secretion system ImpA family protein